MRGCSCRGTAGFAHVSCLAEQAKILREDTLRAVALQGPGRHARRSPRGHGDTRGDGTDCPARARRRSPDHVIR